VSHTRLSSLWSGQSQLPKARRRSGHGASVVRVCISAEAALVGMVGFRPWNFGGVRKPRYSHRACARCHRLILTPLVLPKFRAFCLKRDLATVLISLMLHHRRRPRARRRWLREFGSAPACFSGVAYAVLHALNPRHRTLAPCTRQHADHSVLLLRRHDEALPHDLKTWSAPGTAHLRLPVLQSGRYKGS
jgi:hypothetical protein